MLSTIGMNASRAQWSRYIMAATARIVSATLRTLMFDSTVDVRECDVAPGSDARIGSATLLFHLERETRARLQRLADGDACLAPSAAATTANWTSWEASPTTYTPWTHVSPR